MGDFRKTMKWVAGKCRVVRMIFVRDGIDETAPGRLLYQSRGTQLSSGEDASYIGVGIC